MGRPAVVIGSENLLLFNAAVSGLYPGLDVVPVPEHTCLQFSDWLREICVPGAPVVNHIRERKIETLCYLVGSHDVFGINLLHHEIIIAYMLPTVIITPSLIMTVIT